MYNLLVFLQLLISFILLFLALKLFRFHASRPVQYFQLSLFCMFLLNTGYLLEIQCKSEEAALRSVKLQYCGSVFICTFIFFLLLEYFRIESFLGFRKLLVYFNVVVLIAVVTENTHGLFFSSINFDASGLFPHLVTVPGVFSYCFSIYTSIISLLIFFIVIFFYIKGKRGGRKMPIVFMFVAVVPVAMVMLHLTGTIKVVDLSPLAIGLSGVAIYVLLRKDILFETIFAANNTVVENMQDALLVMDEEMKLLAMNKSARALFPEISESTDKLLLVYDKSDILRTIINEKPKEVISIGDRFYSAQFTKIIQNNYVDGYYILLSDRTDWKLYSDSLIKRSIKAEEESEAKSTLLVNASHDIRTPINSILGMNEMILRESTETNVIERATEVERAGTALMSMINNILDISKIEAGKMDIINVDYDFCGICSEELNMFMLKAKEKKLELKFDIDEQIPSRLNGGEVRIRQVLTNLLSNAVKYTIEGSVKLSISALRKDSKSVDLLFKITDTGRGIRKEDITKLFENFIRIDERENKNVEGSGLGMSIISNILRLMNSEINVESEYGKGSSFSFELKQGVVDETPIGCFNDHFNNGLQKRKVYRSSFIAPEANILVVDDNRVNLEIVKGLLKETKVKIDTLNSGIDCVEAVKNKKYDLILLDHMMPEQDGIETVGILKSMNDNLSITAAVIVLTANAVSGAGSMYKSAGFEDYITKPIDYRKLESMLIKYLPKDLVSLQSTL